MLAVEAEAYFKGENTAIAARPKWKMTKSGREITFSQNIAISNFFFRFVVQQNQFLLANGMQAESQTEKNKLGAGFDKTLESIGEKALVHGTSWGFWNFDHLEPIVAAGDDGARGFFALEDERTGAPRLGIRFWQVSDGKPMYAQVFDHEGITEYRTGGDAHLEQIGYEAYVKKVERDAISNAVTSARAYDGIPVFPLYANEYRRSEFTRSIKTKIDLFDKIFSDFGDNLERTNDVYWVISNFGGSTEDIKEMLAEIEEIKATYAEGEGATATPHTIEVPYAARQAALDLLERALYADYMAMNLNDITGSSLTNVAINTARANMEMKANRYEWQVFQFCQKLLSVAGVETENIKFRRQTISNEMETMQMVVMGAPFLDQQTILEKMPIVEQDEVQTILRRKALEDLGADVDAAADAPDDRAEEAQ